MNTRTRTIVVHIVAVSLLLAFVAAVTLLVVGCAPIHGDPGSKASSSMPTSIKELQDQLARAKLVNTLNIEKAKQEAELQRVQAAEDLETAKATTALDARKDFMGTVKAATGWILLGLAALTVGLMAFAAIPFLYAILPVSMGAAGKSLAGIAIVAMLRYGLLRWGITAASVGFWVSIAFLVVAGAVAFAPLVRAWIARAHLRASQMVASDGDVRAAVALKAAAVGVLGTNEKAKETRKRWLQELTMSTTPAGWPLSGN